MGGLQKPFSTMTEMITMHSANFDMGLAACIANAIDPEASNALGVTLICT